MAYNNPFASGPPRCRAEPALTVKALHGSQLGAQHVQCVLQIGWLCELQRAAHMGNGARKAGTIPTGMRAKAITITTKARIDLRVGGPSTSGC